MSTAPILRLLPPQKVAGSEQIAPLQYTVKETARLLGYSLRTVYRLIEAGNLETTGSRHMLRVTADSIFAYQQRSRNQKEAS